MIKKSVLLVLCISVLLTFSACTGTQKENAGVPASPGYEVIVEDVSDDIDYVAITKDVGPIAHTAQWNSPSEIPVEELLHWYTRYIVGINGDDPAALQSYAVEGTEELHIPASEFEDATLTFFGLEKEHLRLALGNYDKTNQIYKLPMEDVPVSCNVKQVQIAGSSAQVYFELDNGSDTKESYCLTIDTSNGIRFVSCTTAPSEDISENLQAEEHRTEEINEKAPSSASESDSSEDD